MARNIPSGQAQVFLRCRIPTFMHPIPSNYNHGGCPDWPSGLFQYGITGPLQASLTWLLTQVVLALGSLEPSKRVPVGKTTHSTPIIPSGSTRIAPQPQKKGSPRRPQANLRTIYMPIPPNGCVMVPRANTQASLSRDPPAFPFTWVTRLILEYHRLGILLR